MRIFTVRSCPVDYQNKNGSVWNASPQQAGLTSTRIFTYCGRSTVDINPNRPPSVIRFISIVYGD